MINFQIRTLLSLTLLSLGSTAYADILRWDNNQVISGTSAITVGPGMSLHPFGTDFAYADLSSANLSRANMAQVNLDHARFSGSNLEFAQFQESTLTLASFVSSNLFGANFNGGDYTGADFSNANLAHAFFFTLSVSPGTTATSNLTHPAAATTLINANFTGAVLKGADFQQTTLTGSNFTNAAIRGAEFTNAVGFTADQFYSTASYAGHDLAGTGLLGVSMTGWNFSKLYLAGASLSTSAAEANLSWSNFSRASLIAAQVNSANLSGANLQNADLTSTDFQNSVFRGADLRGAISWKSDLSNNTTNTIRPDGSVRGLHIENGETFLVRNSLVPITVKTAATMTQQGTLAFKLEDNFTSPVHFDAGIAPSLTGTLNLSIASGIDPTTLIGHSFQIFAWNAIPAVNHRFSAITAPAGLTWDTSALYTTGVVTLSAAVSAAPVPEPASLMMLVPAAALLRRLRRG